MVCGPTEFVINERNCGSQGFVVARVPVCQ
jgi:hypothetical protein